MSLVATGHARAELSEKVAKLRFMARSHRYRALLQVVNKDLGPNEIFASVEDREHCCPGTKQRDFAFFRADFQEFVLDPSKLSESGSCFNLGEHAVEVSTHADELISREAQRKERLQRSELRLAHQPRKMGANAGVIE